VPLAWREVARRMAHEIQKSADTGAAFRAKIAAKIWR